MSRKPLSKEERAASVVLGKRMAELRKARGFTQVELAKRLELSQAVISSYEIGRLRPNPDVILRLSELLEVSADQLLGREKKPRDSSPGDFDRRFLRRLRLMKKLPKRDQDALLRTIDAFLAARKTT